MLLAMASSGDHSTAARKSLRVLLPFSCDTLRIPDELAEDIGAGDALVVRPAVGKAKLRRVEVGRDDDGAFLGRGWRESTAACGVGRGWLLVLQHRGRGVLTAKAFDDSCCLRELGTPLPAARTTMGRKVASPRPQFISVLPLDSRERMLIPSNFVQLYIHEEHLKNREAIVFCPLGKFGQIELEMNRSDVFFAGGWPQFLASHGITEANALLLRYEGNMVFTVKVFENNGCQRESKHTDVRMQQCKQKIDTEEKQGTPSASSQKSHKNDWPSSYEEKNQKGSITFSSNASLQRKCVYRIGPPSSIKKPINTKIIRTYISLPATFCNAIGIREACMVTLKTSLSSTRSWQVRVRPYKNTGHQVGSGWRRFSRENGIKEGDVCTFNIVETKLWHVIIERDKL